MTSYTESFGFEWTRHPRTQLDGPGQDESERTFREKTGLTPQDIRGKRVLDAGCGVGRFLEVVSRWGAWEAMGIDASEAWRVARKNLEERENVTVWPQDLFALDPTRHQPFDVIYCLGVLHHTPDPAAAVRAIAPLVKPGGRLCVWVYGRMGSWATVASIYRRVTTRLPHWLLHLLCYVAVPWHYVRRIPWVGPAIWLLFPCSTHPKWRWRVLDTFDWYSPTYQSQHTETEVKAWFIDAGFQDIRVGDFPVSVSGVAPCG